MSRSVASLHQRNWDSRAAGNFIAGGTGSGLIVTAALAAAAGEPVRSALMMGLGCVVTGLSLVWLEIGKPWRALNVFFHPHTSWMTREAIVAGLLVPAALIGVGTADATAVTFAALLACGFLYCQARMLRVAQGVPAWRQAEVVPLILATGFAEGSGIFLLVGRATTGWLTLALFACVLRQAAWHAYRAALAGTPAAARSLAAFETITARRARGAHLAGVVLIALALVVSISGARGVMPILAGAGGALAALAGWGLKAVLITRAGFTRAIAVPVIPARGSRGMHARQTSQS
jgi:phenylacetyl-CoA:acceptor oxidoreductase subunit 2